MRTLDRVIVSGFLVAGAIQLLFLDFGDAFLLLWSAGVYRWAIACRKDADRWRDRVLEVQSDSDEWFSAYVSQIGRNNMLEAENERLTRLLEASGEGWRI